MKLILQGHEGRPIRSLEFKRAESSAKKFKSKKKEPEKSKIRSYEEIKNESRLKSNAERRSKNKVESKKIPMKTNNRAEVKITRELKNKANNGSHKRFEEGEEQIFPPVDVEMEVEEDIDPNFQGPYVGPVFTTKQKKYLSKLLDDKLRVQESEMSEFFSNFQVEMTRQFMIQKDELEEMIQSNL